MILACMVKLLEATLIEVTKMSQISGISVIKVSKMNQVSETSVI